MTEFAPPDLNQPIDPSIIIPAAPAVSGESMTPNATEGLITGVPGPGEAPNARAHDPLIAPHEPVPKYFINEAGKNQDNPKLALIENLRGEVVWGADIAQKLEVGYAVVRNIGDQLIMNTDTTGQAASLLTATRWEARPLEHIMAENVNGDDVLAFHNPIAKETTLFVNKLQEEVGNVKAEMQAQGVEFKNPSDALLFVTVNTVAHEAAHAIMGGISSLLSAHREITDTDNRRVINIATRTYLALQPEHALTGSIDTDVKSHEERFAEGYAQAVLGEVMSILGYDENDTQKMFNHFTEKTDISNAEPGKHAVDFLDEVGPNRSLAVIAKEKGLGFGNGDLGYSMPLSLAQVAGQLSDMSRAIKTGYTAEQAMSISREMWDQLVRDRQSDETKAAIKGQLAKRVMQRV